VEKKPGKAARFALVVNALRLCLRNKKKLPNMNDPAPKGIYQKILSCPLYHGQGLVRKKGINFKNYCYDTRKEKSKSRLPHSK